MVTPPAMRFAPKILDWQCASSVILKVKTSPIEFRFAEDKLERLFGLAVELVRLQVDVILAAKCTPAILAAKNATSAIRCRLSSRE